MNKTPSGLSCHELQEGRWPFDVRFFLPASSYNEQAWDGGAIWPGQAFVEHHMFPPCGSGLTYIAWPSHHAGASWLSSPTAGDAGASPDLRENLSYAPSWGLPALQTVFLLCLDPAQPSQEEAAYTSRAALGRIGNRLSG